MRLLSRCGCRRTFDRYPLPRLFAIWLEVISGAETPRIVDAALRARDADIGDGRAGIHQFDARRTRRLP